MKKLIALLVVFLSGCASFSVVPSNRSCESERQVVEAKMIRFDPNTVSKTGLLSAAIISAPESWVKNERSGTASYGSNGVLTVNRDAWRATTFFSDGSEVETSALLGPNHRLIVLLPGADPDTARSARVFVFSGLGTFVLDAEGREYGGENGFDACAFIDHARHGRSATSNPLTIANLSPETEKGEQFLKALYEKFSEKKEFNGKTYLVASVPNIERATSGVSSPDDYLFSNLNALISPGMGVVGVAQAVILTGYATATSQPQGPYREAKPILQNSDFSTPTPDQSGKIGDQ